MLIIVGRDLDGKNLAVGRARHQGDMLPAKVKLEHGIAYVSYGGVEHIKRDFEVQSRNREARPTGFPSITHGIPGSAPVELYETCVLSIARY